MNLRQRTRPVARTRARRLAAGLIAAAALGSAVVGPARAAERPPVKPIASLDVQRYLGEWRQIAALPQWYEALCLSNTVANYSLNPDGTINVVNRCRGPFDAPVVTRGRARVLDATTNAQLQVSFVSLGPSNWLYFGSQPNYVITGLGADYDWAVVADLQRRSAFVLSRTPTLTAAQKAAATATLVGTGFNPCYLKIGKQRGGATREQSFCA